MGVLRCFERTGDLLIDVYARNAVDKPVSFQAPLAALQRLRWDIGIAASPHRPDSGLLEQQRLALRSRVLGVAADELSSIDFREIRRLGDGGSAAVLERRLPDLVARWATSEFVLLADAASAILSLNPTHTESARLLTAALLSPKHDNFVRTQVAGSISDALRLDRDTEAMFALRDALVGLLTNKDGIDWAPFAYSCVRHLADLDRSHTLKRCEEDLRERDEWERGMLLNELAQIPGADVLGLVRRHLGGERSPRVRMRIMRMLGELMAERERAEILRSALGDASPSCRFMAIKALHRLKAETALRLAKRSYAVEPDEYLRRLLSEAVELTRARAQVREPRQAPKRRGAR